LIEKRFDVSWKILLVPHALTFLMGVAYTVVPSVLFGGGFRSFVGMNWKDFASAQPVLSAFVEMHGRETGAMAAAASLLVIFVTLIPCRNRERWAWWSLLAVVYAGLAAGARDMFGEPDGGL
jgi:hypothetical protein